MMISNPRHRNEFWRAQHRRYQREQLRVVLGALGILVGMMIAAYLMGG